MMNSFFTHRRYWNNRHNPKFYYNPGVSIRYLVCITHGCGDWGWNSESRPTRESSMIVRFKVLPYNGIVISPYRVEASGIKSDYRDVWLQRLFKLENRTTNADTLNNRTSIINRTSLQCQIELLNGITGARLMFLIGDKQIATLMGIAKAYYLTV